MTDVICSIKVDSDVVRELGTVRVWGYLVVGRTFVMFCISSDDRAGSKARRGVRVVGRTFPVCSPEFGNTGVSKLLNGGRMVERSFPIWCFMFSKVCKAGTK